jgi:radical SAM protein with 4Fe4S-binding SPASM domain
MLTSSIHRGIHQEIKRLEYQFMPERDRTGPEKMFVDITSRCNIDCYMCWREFSYHNAFGDMTMETFQNILPLMDNMHTVILQGSGEPFMNPKFIEMLKMASKRTDGIMFACNGTIMTEKYAEELVNNRVKKVMLSLDAATKDTYEKIRIGSKWDHVMKNLQKLVDVRARLKSDKPEITLEFVLMRSNVDEIAEFARLAHRFGIKYVGIRHVWVFGEATKNETMFLYPELMKEKFAEAEQVGRELGVYVDLPPQSGVKFAEDYMIESFHDSRFEKLSQPVFEKPAPGKVCYEPWENFWVTWDGNVYPCCQTNRIMGNVNDAAFQEIWNGTAYRQFRKGIKSGDYPKECVGCRNLRDPE